MQFAYALKALIPMIASHCFYAWEWLAVSVENPSWACGISKGAYRHVDFVFVAPLVGHFGFQAI